MLQRSLHELAIGAQLGGPLMADRLCHYLRSLQYSSAEVDSLQALKSKCVQAIQLDLDQRWPRNFRLNELERISGHVCGPTFLTGPELISVQAAFDELMMVDGELISFRPSHVQAYTRLASELEPSLLVAWHLAGCARAGGGPDTQTFERLVDIQTPFFAPPALEHREVAENHAHLGGIFGDAPVLAQLVLGHRDDALSAALAKERDPEDIGVLVRLMRVRRLLRVFLDVWTLSPDTSGVSLKLSQACDEDLRLSQPHQGTDWQSLTEGTVSGTKIGAAWLLAQLARAVRDARLQQAWIWLFVALWWTYRDPESPATLRAGILATVCELMVLRRRLVMDGQGLRRFTERYYSPPMRTLARKDATWGVAVIQDTVARVMIGPRDLAELKITPDAFDPRTIARLARAVSGIADDPTYALLAQLSDAGSTERRQMQRAAIDRWHFCVHFSRSGERTNLLERRRILWNEAVKLQAGMFQHSGWRMDALLGGYDNSELIFQPSRFVRGLDVAGDETKWPIEYFAPVLRWLRSARHADSRTRTPTPRPHFSIHAGEDYAHPLSGLRHVDETVQFCGMSRHDRLGHALALGITPVDWLTRHGDALIPVDEHLDNLVWAWHSASELASRLPLAARVLPRLERRIRRFLPHASWQGPRRSALLGEPPSDIGPRPGPPLTLDELHDAWLLRRNCAHTLLREDPRMPLLDDRMTVGVPDHQRLFNAIGTRGFDPAADLFLDRARAERESQDSVDLLVLLRAPGDFERQHQEHLEEPSRADSQLLHDHDEPDDVDFMEALQDSLLDRYEQLGLVLEANPSSNVYIGRMVSHREHPIFRWRPLEPAELAPQGSCNRFGLRRGEIPVTINTDDQGIMPTTLRTELQLMREAAVDRGASGSVADAWIERIRRLGIDEFSRNHLPVFEGP